MKTALIILAIIAIGGGILFAKGRVSKTDKGFKVETTRTYYQNRVIWGDGYTDHQATSPITGIAVLAVGTGWTYSAVTDATGLFKVEVKPDEAFTIRVSDGNTWIDYPTKILGIAEGTTKSEVE